MTQIPGVRAKLAIFLLGLGFAVQGFASNLVTNGDFESGNSGFSTDYTFWPIGTSGDMDAGFYSVVSSANQIHGGFGGAPQGGSKFFVANGATDTSQGSGNRR